MILLSRYISLGALLREDCCTRTLQAAINHFGSRSTIQDICSVVTRAAKAGDHEGIYRCSTRCPRIHMLHFSTETWCEILITIHQGRGILPSNPHKKHEQALTGSLKLNLPTMPNSYRKANTHGNSTWTSFTVQRGELTIEPGP